MLDAERRQEEILQTQVEKCSSMEKELRTRETERAELDGMFKGTFHAKTANSVETTAENLDLHKRVAAYEQMLHGYEDAVRKAKSYEEALDAIRAEKDREIEELQERVEQMRTEKERLVAELRSTGQQLTEMEEHSLTLEKQVDEYAKVTKEKEEEIRTMSNELFDLRQKGQSEYVPAKVLHSR